MCRLCAAWSTDSASISDNFFLNLHPFLAKEPALRIRQRNIVPDILSEPLMELRDSLLELTAGIAGGGT